MVLGVNGVSGRLVLQRVMVEIKPERDFVTIRYLAMVEMNVLLITLQIPKFRHVTQIHAQVKVYRGSHGDRIVYLSKYMV